MSTQDARGHTVPEGSDPAARQSILDLSLSIPSVRTCSSQAEAVQHVDALKNAGITATAASPIFVFRSDLATLYWWDGQRWSSTRQVQLQAMAGWGWDTGGGIVSLSHGMCLLSINIQRRSGEFFKNPSERVDIIDVPAWLPKPKASTINVGMLFGWGIQPMALEFYSDKIWFVPDVKTTIHRDYHFRGIAIWGF